MSIFDLFKKKKATAPADESNLDLVWELWEKGEAKSPYAEIMTYQSEVNNGGHMQFFDNVSATSDLETAMSALGSVLTGKLLENLTAAYGAYLNANDDDDALFDILDECDDIYYENEEQINEILKKYASELT